VTKVFDTSFQVLEGASGAPVLDLSNLSVVGMMIANTETTLQAARVEEDTGPGGRKVRTSYYLPMGQAIEGELIAEFLLEIAASATILD
jgi:hypothetical protein